MKSKRSAGGYPMKFNQISEMDAALDGVEIEVPTRWRNPVFPVPAVHDVRKPVKQPEKP
jgi:hypothetical protein